jgi:hypothetical protein
MISAVPTISRFMGIVIAMFFDDHDHRTFMPVTQKEVRKFGSTRSR